MVVAAALYWYRTDDGNELYKVGCVGVDFQTNKNNNNNAC